MGNRKQIVTVFGNPVVAEDSLAVQLVPELEERFPEVAFEITDPTENLEPPSDPWIILDVGIGIDEVVVIESLEDLEQVKGQSVHDYDVYLELRLKEKLGQLPKVKIVIVPMDMKPQDALALIENTLKDLL